MSARARLREHLDELLEQALDLGYDRGQRHGVQFALDLLLSDPQKPRSEVIESLKAVREGVEERLRGKDKGRMTK